MGRTGVRSWRRDFVLGRQFDEVTIAQLDRLTLLKLILVSQVLLRPSPAVLGLLVRQFQLSKPGHLELSLLFRAGVLDCEGNTFRFHRLLVAKFRQLLS